MGECFRIEGGCPKNFSGGRKSINKTPKRQKTKRKRRGKRKKFSTTQDAFFRIFLVLKQCTSINIVVSKINSSKNFYQYFQLATL